GGALALLVHEDVEAEGAAALVVGDVTLHTQRRGVGRCLHGPVGYLTAGQPGEGLLLRGRLARRGGCAGGARAVRLVLARLAAGKSCGGRSGDAESGECGTT